MPNRRKQYGADYDEDMDDMEDMEAEKQMDVQGQLHRLIDPDYADKFVASLHPVVQNRVRALQGMQSSITELHTKYMEEHKAIEKKFEALYAPIFAKRAEIVQGVREPTDEEVTRGQGPDYTVPEGANEEEDDKPGVPGFWLTAMKNHDAIGEIIEERDEECLKCLKNITAKPFDDPDTGFTLEFHFAENEFFNNTILTKTYHLIEEDEIVLDKSEGCEIAWKPGKNLTVTMKKKKVKGRGGKPGRQVTSEEPCPSFFNFFKPPQIPEGADDDDDDDDMEETMEELVEADYEIGCAIQEQLIPKAVLWYTGEAGDQFDDDDDDDDDDDAKQKKAGDDDDSDDDDPPPRKGGKDAGKGGGKKGGGNAGGAQPECKQQ